jgi:hypothetical protein
VCQEQSKWDFEVCLHLSFFTLLSLYRQRNYCRKQFILLFFFACPKKNETRLPVKLPKVVRQERTLLQDALFALASPMLHKFLLKYCNKKLENSFSFFLSLLQKETKKSSQNDASTLPYEFCNFLIKGSTRL